MVDPYIQVRLSSDEPILFTNFQFELLPMCCLSVVIGSQEVHTAILRSGYDSHRTLFGQSVCCLEAIQKKQFKLIESSLNLQLCTIGRYQFCHGIMHMIIIIIFLRDAKNTWLRSVDHQPVMHCMSHSFTFSLRVGDYSQLLP